MTRDDSGSFLGAYQETEIMKKNPFASIDQTGVGQLMQIAIEKGRQTRPDIKLGICGEHGGDPDSVKFCHKLGLTYVSCSPLPRARRAPRRRPGRDRRSEEVINHDIILEAPANNRGFFLPASRLSSEASAKDDARRPPRCRPGCDRGP